MQNHSKKHYVGVFEIFHNLKSILSERGLETAVGDEGGFAPKFEGTEDLCRNNH